MKLINSLQGACAFQFSPDDIAPDTGVLTRDLVAFLGEEFKFSGKPEVPPGLILLASQEWTFQAGECTIDKKKVPITQLTYIYSGIIVTAKNSDIAEHVAEHIATILDGKFGLKIMSHIRMRYYASDIIVEFNPAFEQQVSGLGRMKAVLEREIPRPGHPFDLRRLALGSPDQALAVIAPSLDNFPNQDFVLERRAGEPHSSNRYYCHAALKTKELVRVLSLIEEAVQERQ